MTTTTEPRTAVPTVPPPATPTAIPTAPILAPETRKSAPDAAASAPDAPAPRSAAQWFLIILGAVVALGCVGVGVLGFVLSFTNVSAAAIERWHFGPSAGPAFAIGMDVSIFTFLALDLLLVVLGVKFPWLRWAAHAMTGATIYFNASAHGTITGDPSTAFAHGLMPLLFIVGIEAGRRLLLKRFRPQRTREGIPLGRWIMSPWPTWTMWRRMVIWEVRSYADAIKLERDRAIYRAWLDHKDDIESDKGGPRVLEQRLLTLGAKFGLSVDEALALPEQMRADEQRREIEAERSEMLRGLEREREQAATDAERIRIQAGVDAVRTEVRSDAAVAQAEAQRRSATAELRATEAVAEAQRAVEDARTRAAREDAAVKTATEAEAEQRAAEAEQRAAEARKAAAEADKGAAEARAVEVGVVARTEATKRRVTEDRAETARLALTEAEHLKRSAEAREAAAAAEARAVEAEDYAQLKHTERGARRVARMILAAGGDPEAVPLTMIADALGISESTASVRRTEAVELLAQGYRP